MAAFPHELMKAESLRFTLIHTRVPQFGERVYTKGMGGVELGYAKRLRSVGHRSADMRRATTHPTRL